MWIFYGNNWNILGILWGYEYIYIYHSIHVYMRHAKLSRGAIPVQGLPHSYAFWIITPIHYGYHIHQKLGKTKRKDTEKKHASCERMLPQLIHIYEYHLSRSFIISCIIYTYVHVYHVSYRCSSLKNVYCEHIRGIHYIYIHIKFNKISYST